MGQRKYQHLVESIVNSEAKKHGDFDATSELAAELLFSHLDITTCNVWLVDPKQNQLDLVAHSGAFTVKDNAQSIKISVYSEYLAVLKNSRHIDVSDAHKDQRVAEFKEHYIEPFDIGSFLDVPIRINGKLEGVLHLSLIHEQRKWTDCEIFIACQIADQLALTLATKNNYKNEEFISLLKSSVEQSKQITMLVNLETDIVEYVNEAYATITGVPTEQFIGHSVQELIIFQQEPEHSFKQWARLKQGMQIQSEIKLTRADGEHYWVRYQCSPFTTEQGNLYALVNSEDCTARYLYQEELEHQAWHCSLTGLFNRTHFNQVLEKTKKGVLLLIDLVGFKHFNDTYGHARGDSLLKEVARRLRHFADINHVTEIARVGSDEFALLIEGACYSRDVQMLTEKLYQQLSLRSNTVKESFEPKTAIAIVDIAAVVDLVSPLTSADIALQHAKEKSTVRIQLFNKKLLSEYENNAQVELDLTHALANRQFELYYQPLRDLDSGHYSGAEALIRWNHPKKGVLYPGSFIDIAEKTGLINEIGQWVLEAACRQLNVWQHYNKDISMHVNVAAKQFFSDTLFDDVWRVLNQYQIKPQSLVLEITETELMEDIHYATNLCQELVDLGVGIAIDDFGTGYSSMQYLRQFPISKLKIDRSFICDIHSSLESREIVSAIIAMAKALGISLTAEGVENAEQEAFLKQQQCHQAQGFLYSPAIREAEFNQFVNKQKQGSTVIERCSPHQ
ncbi:MAG: sensor domain-containing phosphodiesterase [Parashewanella sp.]